jgi:hypothetical protein
MLKNVSIPGVEELLVGTAAGGNKNEGHPCWGTQDPCHAESHQMCQKVLVPKLKQPHQAFQAKFTVKTSSVEILEQQIKGLGGGISNDHLSRSTFLPIPQGFLEVFEPRKHGEKAGAGCHTVIFIIPRKFESDHTLHRIRPETWSNPILGKWGAPTKDLFLSTSGTQFFLTPSSTNGA